MLASGNYQRDMTFSLLELIIGYVLVKDLGQH